MVTKTDIKKYKQYLPELGCISCLDQNTLHLAADGCFKLNRLKRSSAAKFNPKINQFYCEEELNSSHSLISNPNQIWLDYDDK